MTDNPQMEAFYRENWPKLKRFFACKVPSEEAYDLASETIRIFLEKEGTETEKPRSFMWGIARNKLLHHLRRRVSSGVFDSTRMSVVQMGTTLSSTIDKRERLLAALKSLPLDQQTAFEYRACEELSLDEVAEAMGVSRATVNRYLKSARESLQRQLKGDEAAVVEAYRAG